MNTKIAQPAAGQMTPGSVVSKDGTRIGYLFSRRHRWTAAAGSSGQAGQGWQR